ncbi:MAG: HEAT repeat domain-containing protein [Phycisphaerae bacterium]|nr:HEAT repeat domain-containing protein [Phycisphaerae bacterium]
MKNDLLNQILFVGLLLLVAGTAGAATERDLIAILQSNAGAVEKCAACQQLRICGTAQSVTALAAVLGDERVGHAARYALEGMPYAEASVALREALVRTSGAIKVGLIDSVGRRRDTAATPLLVPLLSDADSTIAVAAASALGWIGDEATTAGLNAARDSRLPEVKNAVLASLLRCAAKRLSQGNNSEAATLYRSILEAAPAAGIRNAAWRGVALADGEHRTELVLGALTGDDNQLRLMAIKVIRETKEDQALRAGLRQWRTLSADAQVLLVDVLADRGDPSFLANVLEACQSPEKAVRIAGIKAVGALGDGANVALLTERAARTSGEEQAAARASFRVLRGKNVNTAMIGGVDGGETAAQVELIQALADRHAAEATPVLLQTAASHEASVRTASYRALGELAGADETEALVALLAKAAGGEQPQLENAILRVARRANATAQTSKAVLAKLDSVGDARLKGMMIGILGQLGDASALPTLRRALSDPDTVIRYAAIAGLGRWPDAAPLPDLLQIARDNKSGGSQIRALRAYVDLVGAVASMEPQEKVKCYATAMGLAPDAALKKRMLAALANVKTIEAMQLAASSVQDEQVKEEAAMATVTIAKDISAGNASPVKAALERVVAANVRSTTKEQAQKILDDITATQSYLMNWEVAGPYLEQGKNYSQLFDIPFDPEKPKAKVEWRKMPVSTNGPHPAYCDLLKELNGGEQRVAYLRTQIESDDLKPVTLEIFSDDGVKVWLNGRVIHANNVARPIGPEPDRVTTTLEKGTNRLMLKVTQNNLPWGAIVRVREAKVVPPKVGERFKLHVINADSRFEAAGVLDVNRDGKLDIFCGGFWYEAPDWKRHFVRDVKEEGNYFYDFANLPMDVDGDGWVDIANAAWHNKMIFWERNPGAKGGPWEVFPIDTPGNMETALAVDINGDGQPDVLPNIMSEVAWYEFHRDASAPGGARWEKHQLPKEAAGHGIGAGDINKDGRCDIVAPKGWLEQTATGWQWHPEFDLGQTSIPILVHDVDADGDSDIIWGLGHDYGMYWLEQKNVDGHRTWEKHLIDKSWSQPHFMVMADLDNDGKAELVAGKRYYAHNGHDPGENDPECAYYYKFDAATKNWTRHTIHEGGRVGFGINTAVVDIDGDGDLDVVAPGKSGLYLLENLTKNSK